MLNIKTISSQEEWNRFLMRQEHSAFLQSWEWGELQKELKRKIWRWGIADQDDNLILTALISQYILPFKKSYLYCPRGPIIDQWNIDHRIEAEKLFLKKIQDIALLEKNIFFRFDPDDNTEILKFQKIKKVKSIQPADTWLLDLTHSEAELLQNLHPKTRYNLRLAEKKGVKIIISREQKELIHFFDLLSQTAKRNKFKIYPFSYFQNLIKNSALFDVEEKQKNLSLEIYCAEYGGELMAANLVISFGDTVTYLFGGSKEREHNLMAPHLLHWEIIKMAKQRGFHYYDFWGIAPEDEPEHPWTGLTRFKKSFGGFAYHYPGTFEWPIDKGWYRIYRLAKKLIK